MRDECETLEGIGATSDIDIKIDTHSCNLGEDVTDFRFELGVENSVSEIEHVLVCLSYLSFWS